MIRYTQGKESARGYYEDAHDYTAFKERLLKPLGPNGNLQYETISHNLKRIFLYIMSVNGSTQYGTHSRWNISIEKRR